MEDIYYQYTITTHRSQDRTTCPPSTVIAKMTLPDGSQIKRVVVELCNVSSAFKHRVAVDLLLKDFNSNHDMKLKISSYRALELHHGFIWFLKEK